MLQHQHDMIMTARLEQDPSHDAKVPTRHGFRQWAGMAPIRYWQLNMINPRHTRARRRALRRTLLLSPSSVFAFASVYHHHKTTINMVEGCMFLHLLPSQSFLDWDNILFLKEVSKGMKFSSETLSALVHARHSHCATRRNERKKYALYFSKV